jgi:hypothetical protein
MTGFTNLLEVEFFYRKIRTGDFMEYRIKGKFN